MVKRLAIVGSGTGGTFTANLLAGKLREGVVRGEVVVELFGEKPDHIFQPANLDVAFKGASPKRFTKKELDLLKSSVTFVPDPVATIDLANRTITTESGEREEYDELVIATGAVPSPELVPGLREGSLNFHTSPEDAKRIWGALEGFRGGRIVLAIAGIPHKCPPSPNEAMFLMDEYFRRRGIRERVKLTFLTPYPRVYPAATISEAITPIFEERGIETVPFFNVDYVDPTQKKVYSLEGDVFDYDLLLSIPPHRGARVVSDSGIGDDEGWIPTNRTNLKIPNYDDAYAIGDATNIPISKSGVVAHLEAKVVANNIVSEIQGADVEFGYNGRINCPMELGGGRAIMVSATYDTPPKEQTPSMVKYIMKRSFGHLYWSALMGSWEWLFGMYFGETSKIAHKGIIPA